MKRPRPAGRECSRVNAGMPSDAVRSCAGLTTLKTMRQLSDAELILLAVTHCRLSSKPYAELIDVDIHMSADAEEIEVSVIPYQTKVTLLLAAADYGPRPH
jgi:hypothetical protein